MPALLRRAAVRAWPLSFVSLAAGAALAASAPIPVVQSVASALPWAVAGTVALLAGLRLRKQRRELRALSRIVRTERRARESLAAGEGRLRRLLEIADVGICIAEADGRFLFANRYLAELLGYTADEMRSRSFRTIVHPEDLGPEHFPAPPSTRHDHRVVEKRLLRKDGATLRCRVSVRAIDAGQAGGAQYLGLVEDLTAQRAAEHEAAAHRRVRDFHFDHTPMAVVEWGRDYRVRRWSRRAAQLLGWGEADALGRSAEELSLLGPSDLAVHRQRLERMFCGRQDHASAVSGVLHRSGRPMSVEGHHSALRGEDGGVEAVVSMLHDCTEQQEMLRMLNESEARFRGIFHQAAVGIALVDPQGRWLTVNQRLCEITGYAAEELVSREIRSITHADDFPRIVELTDRLLHGEIPSYTIEKRYVRKDGETVWVEMFMRPIDGLSGSQMGFVSVVADIGERKAAEARALALASSLESQVAERTAQLREIIQAGRRRNDELSLVTEMTGLLSAASDSEEASRVVGHYLPLLFPKADGAVYFRARGRDVFERQAWWGDPNGSSSAFAATACWALRRGEPHLVEGAHDPLHCQHIDARLEAQPHLCVPLFALGGAVGLIELAWGRRTDGWAPDVPLVKTIAEQIGLALGNLRLREEMSRQATVDPLTGLYNRRWLEADLARRLAEHARGGAGFTVLILDIDHFKQINDRYGHDAGDAALREVAAALRVTVRTEETCVRYGGEEFVVVLSTDHEAPAMVAAERIRAAIPHLSIVHDGQTLPPLSMSIGLAAYPRDGADAAAIVARADEALYAAKRAGRDRVVRIEDARAANAA